MQRQGAPRLSAGAFREGQAVDMDCARAGDACYNHKLRMSWGGHSS